MPVKRHDMASSLPLQIALYWNAVYAVVYVVFGLTVCVWKLTTYETEVHWIIVPPALFVVWAVLEYMRIRLGYQGNLRGKVPELSAFILITFFPQIPILGVLAFIQAPQLPVEMITAFPLMALLISEMFLSYSAVRVLIAKQTAQFFRLCQEAPANDSDEVNPLLTA